ncbi:FKBP-type peptidyl-prolyl cis-trans isomerase [Flavicella marina]|uniref:FKBP-type peptidyl-prolyl cis-trans isomerase n=1 Tax=Flavicella marina TaxID=1475951 RepID=UPI0012654404|nr:FKBP-type peptidyl-prolyl cis-trans isomerase [Flavicella marina]
MKSLKAFLSFLLIVTLTSCLSDPEPGIEQYYENRDDGIAFLEANKSNEGVIVTDSGLQYKVETEGIGDFILESDLVQVHITTSKIDGTVLYSTESTDVEDLEFAEVNRFISGIVEGLQLMKQGGKHTLYIPHELAYGEFIFNNIDPFSVIVAEVEVVRVGNDDTDFLVENAEKEDVITTESGLQYKIVSEGEGDFPTVDSLVDVNLKGTLIDDSEFVNTWGTGENGANAPLINLSLSTTIAGITEGLQLMKPGARYVFYLPYQLGYGVEGRTTSGGVDIPPYATLIFDIEYIE